MGKSSSSPEYPDPRITIPLQEGANRRAFDQTLQAMRPTEVTPFGTSSWSNERTFDQSGYDTALAEWQARNEGAKPTWTSYGDNSYPDMGYWSAGKPDALTGPAPSKDQYYKDNWTRNVELASEQQALLDRQNANSQGMADQTAAMLGPLRERYSQPLDLASRLEQVPGVSYDAGSRQRVEEALLRRIRAEQDPRLAKERQSLNNQLLQTGFNMADKPYGDTMGRFDFDARRMDADAVDRSILLGGQEATGELQRGVTAQNAELNRALQEIAAKAQDRGRALNEFNAFRSGSQMQMPDTQGSYSAPQSQPVDYIGAYDQQYNNLLGASNASAASSDNFLSGLMGLGGAFLGGPQGSAAATLMSRLLGGG